MMIGKLRERRMAHPAVVAVLMLGLVSVAPGAEAGEMSRSGQNFAHKLKFELVEVGDVEGHIVAVYEQEGIITFSDGQVAEFKNSGTLDYVNWEGVHRGYHTVTFKDGSTHTVRYEGTSKKTPEGRVGTGTHTFVGGTGKFAGIKGEGSYRSINPKNHKMSIHTWEENITLPD
jgi:hypothetical protein